VTTNRFIHDLEIDLSLKFRKDVFVIFVHNVKNNVKINVKNNAKKMQKKMQKEM
jgi:hypothetical protein